MGELISKAVYAGVNEAILKQNKITAKRHVFQRLKERRLSIHGLVSDLTCDCLHQKGVSPRQISTKVDDLLLEKEYAAFIEAAMALSDEYEKGLVKDLSLFNLWCRTVANQIAGTDIGEIPDYLSGRQEIPVVLRSALNAVIAGAANNQEENDD